MASAVKPRPEAAQVDAAALPPLLMQFADRFASEIEVAAASFVERCGTPEAQIQALTWRVEYTSATIRMATSAQPYSGLFDMLVLFTALRVAHETHHLPRWGEADRPMLEVVARQEQFAWKLAEQALTAEQMTEARRVVDGWLAGASEGTLTELARLPSFSDLVVPRPDAPNLFGQLGELVRIDPLAGLEPAAREVEETRLLAERLVFFLQRFPELASARVELLVLRGTQTDEARGVLEGWERVTRAATSVATTAQELPSTLSAERAAAVEQVSAELERLRQGLLEDIERARGPLEEVLGETHAAATATRELSDSLRETIAALGAFLDRFEKPDEDPLASGPEPAAGTGHPFDVTEYGAAAEQIGAAVRELNATLAALDSSLPGIRRTLDEVALRGERTVDHVSSAPSRSSACPSSASPPRCSSCACSTGFPRVRSADSGGRGSEAGERAGGARRRPPDRALKQIHPAAGRQRDSFGDGLPPTGPASDIH